MTGGKNEKETESLCTGNDGGNDDVKLTHKQCREQLMGTEPIAEYLLALTQRQLAYGNKQSQHHQHLPEK